MVILKFQIVEELIKNSNEGNGVLLDIEVSTNARDNRIDGINEWRKRIVVKIKAQPIGGKANKEIVKFFKKMFNKDVGIVSGLTSAQKTVLIKGDKKEILNILLREIAKSN